MSLPSELISQFVRATKDVPADTKKEETVHGTAVEKDGKMYVQLDGSDVLTPVSTTTDIEPGERVTVLLKNHIATVTGNLSSPAARTHAVQNLSGKISELDIVIANKVDAEQLTAEIARINELKADNVTIHGKLDASDAEIEDLKAVNVTIQGKLDASDAEIENLKTNKLDVAVADAKFATIESLDVTNANIRNLNVDYGDFKRLTADKLTVNEANISKLQTEKLSASEAEIKYATVENLNASKADIDTLEADFGTFKAATVTDLNAAKANIEDLEAKKLSVEDANVTYANIDFSNIGKAAMEYMYANSGLIRDVVIGDATISGHLAGVTISGDLIEGNTIKAEKLVIKGSDGLYYQLNTNGITIEAEQTDENSLNGSIIRANSITASKIDVADLVAFDATIGGFVISETAIHSGVKDSVDNTTTGIYLDKDGQMAIGDTNNYIKYYKDQNGNHKLVISADSILIGSSKTNLEQKFNEYYTKEQTDAAIKVQSDSITSTVSSQYATKQEVSGIKIGGRNIAPRSTTLWGADEATCNRGIQLIYTADILAPYVGPNDNDIGEEVTLSFEIKLAEDGVLRSWNSVHVYPYQDSGVSIEDTRSLKASFEWQRIVLTTRVKRFKQVEGYTKGCIYLYDYGGDNRFHVRRVKLELGNKATDWTPAIEDTDTAIQNAQATGDSAKAGADSAAARLSSAESIITQLADSISMLIVDENGESLMEQDGDGWKFSMASTRSDMDKISNDLNNLVTKVGDTDSVIEGLQTAVNKFDELGNYVRITTFEGEPCIELGKSNPDGNEFKVLITNTRILFKEDASTPAYMTNQSLYISKADINELRQGDNGQHGGQFVWSVRANGNYGLLWTPFNE